MCLAAGSLAVNAQQKEFAVIGKDRYFLGETPTITIVITNTGRSVKMIKLAEHQRFSLEMEGLFERDRRPENKKTVYDCCWFYPPQTDPNITFWYTLVKLPDKYVTLRPGQSSSVTIDLAHQFHSLMGPGAT